MRDLPHQSAASGTAAPETHRLTAGVLTLAADPPGAGLGPLFEVAERINPKRAFLFVSTVLGRHIPVRASDHRAAVRALAGQVLSGLGDGPILVMGYAETAVGLGAGVARAIRLARPGVPVLYLPTTRHPVAGRDWLAFSEDHSHATDHTVLRPDPHPALGDPAARLVLVDDETTTGATFAALAGALAGAGLRFAEVVCATLTDWSGGAAADRLAGTAIAPGVRAVSLQTGRWSWAPDPSAPRRALPEPGIARSPAFVPAGDAPWSAPRLGAVADPDLSGVAERLGIAPGSSALVIGSGEHVWQPCLLAEALEARGVPAACLATTRSPILEGAVIRHKLTFPDHFGLGLPMYLHNADPGAWDEIVLCTETGLAGLSPDLLAGLAGGGARLRLIDGTGTVTEHRA